MRLSLSLKLGYRTGSGGVQREPQPVVETLRSVDRENSTVSVGILTVRFRRNNLEGDDERFCIATDGEWGWLTDGVIEVSDIWRVTFKRIA
ncbi:unnamed protein product, partial [Anisakis simplex]|uniref:Phage protein n=1 Tax=Anisakis simplex TaxID=6269 RepID=A0A0M3JHY8_ANISI